ncbi:MAG TPA: OsmC family protein [Solirubrobacterales bacterium]
MPTRSSSAQWSGNLARGSGTMSLGSGAFEGSYSFASRFEDGDGTNPEELIAAAHAGCFSMQLAALLSQAGHEPESVQTTAVIHLDKDDGGFSITRSDLSTEVKADGLDDAELQKHAEEAEKVCPVSRALGAIEIGMEAKLA